MANAATAIEADMTAQVSPRGRGIAEFLDVAGWGKADRWRLAGDASFRKYDRLQRGDEFAVLMDAPPPEEDVRPFVARAKWLAEQDIHAPKILAADEEKGLLLLEDLGDALFTEVLEKDTSREEGLYRKAMDVLADFYHAGVPQIDDIIEHSHEKMLQESLLFCEWFLPHVVGVEKAQKVTSEFIALWHEVFTEAELQHRQFVHWDFHAGNLLWLEQQNAIGVIDFQDGMIGDSAFDVVSLLEDARRDVSEVVVASSLDRYLDATGQNREEFMRRYAVLGAQRNMKIIGIFVRLTQRDGKPHYLEFRPRVWAHLERDLQHPIMAKLKAFVDDLVPQETRGVTQLRDDVVLT